MASTTSDSQTHIRVLAVDDSPMILKLVKMSLSNLPYWHVDTAENATQAQHLWQKDTYDLMIVDFNMPNTTGLELLKQLSPPVSAKNKVIMLSADNGQDLKHQARALNVTGWMHKPFQPQSLIKVANQVLKADHPQWVTDDGQWHLK